MCPNEGITTRKDEEINEEIENKGRKGENQSHIEESDDNEWNDTLKRAILQLEESGTVPKQNHEALNDLVVIDELTLERAILNNDVNTMIDNEILKGEACTMIRKSKTSVTDTSGTASHQKVCQHFRGKQRRFEIQMQFQLKKVPSNGQKLFIAFEVDDPIQLSKLQRTILECVMTFAKRRNNGFYYNLSGQEKIPGDKKNEYEKPHISFVLESCSKLLHITKPNQVAPTLGGELPAEEPEAFKRRKKGLTPVEWNTDDIYTIAIWAAYTDVLTWECLGIPAVPKFSLSNILGNQVFHFNMYLADANLKQHRQCDITRFMSFEFGHAQKTNIGPSAKKWLQKFGILKNHDGTSTTVTNQESSTPVTSDESSTTVSNQEDSTTVSNQEPIMMVRNEHQSNNTTSDENKNVTRTIISNNNTTTASDTKSNVDSKRNETATTIAKCKIRFWQRIRLWRISLLRRRIHQR